jgi:hypothetical protein
LASKYVDLPELEAVRGGESVPEADLIAFSQNKLVVAEAKINDSLNSSLTGKRSIEA